MSKCWSFSLLCCAALLSSCGLSEKEKLEVASVACSVMAETSNMDRALRVKEINAARKQIGEPSFLDGDNIIKQAIKFDMCEGLVLNDPATTQRLSAFTYDSGLSSKQISRILRQEAEADIRRLEWAKEKKRREAAKREEAKPTAG